MLSLYLILIVFSILCLLFICRRCLFNLVHSLRRDFFTISASQQEFYGKLYSVLPLEYSLVTNIKVSDLKFFIPELTKSEHRVLSKKLEPCLGTKADFIVLNEGMKICCFIKFNGNSQNNYSKDVDTLADAVKVPCFSFKDSNYYDFQDVLEHL